MFRRFDLPSASGPARTAMWILAVALPVCTVSFPHAEPVLAARDGGGGCSEGQVCGKRYECYCENPAECYCDAGDCLFGMLVPSYDYWDYATEGYNHYKCLTSSVEVCASYWSRCIPIAAQSSCANNDGCTGDPAYWVPLPGYLYSSTGVECTP